MNKHLIFLNIPPLPEVIENELIEICKNITINPDRYKKFKSLYSQDINFAAQEYNTERIGTIPKYVTEEIQNLYSNYFWGGVFGFLGKTSNMSEGLSFLPPHCDSQRRTAINYLLKSGGSNVKTTLYEEKRKKFNLLSLEILDYNQVNIKEQHIVPVKKWHVFNPQRYHSVENIEDERYYFSLGLLLNPSFKKFKKTYKNIII
jgi:hypothetical protein